MNESQGAKQQIVERIKQSSNILVTVSKDPSVDELSAALGLTIMLNNLNKHATAVVSGKIPPAIEFLEPGKTFENTVDSLRDFIIALDKEKADHLRYKVDGDVVKIFITPYRTTITEKDLDFSQGDYNVELVLALGVDNKDDLDAALAAHGRILHDAAVATMTGGDKQSELGSIGWNEPAASSISEMLVSLSEALKTDETVLDEQTATAFLTGIVAATDRFSNNKTSSKVMTMAAQLMAAGANQQLIAAKLEAAHEIGPESTEQKPDQDDKENSDGTTSLSEGKSSKVNKRQAKKPKAEAKPAEKPASDDKPEEKPAEADGGLAISHEKEGDVDQVAKATAEEAQESAAQKAEDALSNQLEYISTPPPATPSVDDLRKDVEAASAEVDKAASEEEVPQPEAELPPLPPVANAGGHDTTISKHTSQIDTDNKPLITQSPINATVKSDQTSNAPATPMLPPLPPVEPQAAPVASPPAAPAPAPQHDEKTMLADIEAAYGSAPFSPANQPVASVGAQQLGDIPHGDAAVAPAPQLQDLPPLPDFSAPLPPPPPLFEQPPVVDPAASAAPSVQGPAPLAPPPAQPNDPAQFKIPGQG